MSSVNLQELRPQFERELRKVGAVIEVCTPNQLQFVGGTIPWRPLIVLRGGIVEASSGSHLICRARISASTAFLPLFAAIVFWPLSLVSSFFIPVAALLSLAGAVVLVGAWGQANTWLNSLIEPNIRLNGMNIRLQQASRARRHTRHRPGIAQLFALACALLAAYASTPAHAAAEWREASTDHFIIYADASEKWLRGFAERLEKFDSGLRHIHGMETLPEGRSNRLVIYVVANEAAVGKLCGADCANVGGFYVPRIGGSIAFTPREVRGSAQQGFTPEVVLFHEYTHHFLLANSSGAHPRWLNEGYAEFNSTAEEARDGSMCFGRAAQHRAYGLLEGAKLPLEVVLDPGARKFSRQEQDTFYGRSWLLLHYLKFEEARSGQILAYAEAFNNGKSSLEAARAVFGDLAQLDKDMDRYLGRRTLSCRRIAAENLTAGTIAMRTLSAGEAATMALRMRSDRGVDQQQAQALVPEGRFATKAFADDAGAQSVLAEIEYDAGNLDEAELAADRALAADSKALGALLYKGRVAVRRLEDAGSDDAPAWIKARSWFVKANQLDHDAAEPLYLFFMSFIQQREQPTENAVAALTRAFKLSPQDYALRWMYAQHLLNSDRTAEARVVLMPLAYDPHQSGDNRALAMVRAIDSGATGRKVFDAVSGRESAVEPPPQPE